MSKNNKDQNKNRIKSLEHLNCTVTGLPVTQKSEWTNLTFGQDNYRMTYSLIGQNIILSKVKGYTNLHACKEYFFTPEEINSEKIEPDPQNKIKEKVKKLNEPLDYKKVIYEFEGDKDLVNTLITDFL